jgi:hypothetical protein
MTAGADTAAVGRVAYPGLRTTADGSEALVCV